MTAAAAAGGAGRHRTDVLFGTSTDQAARQAAPGSRRVAGIKVRPPLSLRAAIGWAQCELRPRRRGPSVPWYLLLNGTEPRWRLHATVDSADLDEWSCPGFVDTVAMRLVLVRCVGARRWRGWRSPGWSGGVGGCR